jgi:diacylglycerol kinase (ATP)
MRAFHPSIHQVVDLATEDPARALRLFLELPRLRILVCGGDGTAKWIMGVLEELDPDCWPPIAILPLGTGNDLGQSRTQSRGGRHRVALPASWLVWACARAARVLGWGGGYNNESIVDFLAQVQRAHVVSSSVGHRKGHSYSGMGLRVQRSC